MSTPTNSDVQTKLRALVDVLLGYLKDVNNTKSLKSSENIDCEAVLNDLGKLGIILADNATKVTIACKPPCIPISAIPTIEAMGETLFRISGFVESIPLSTGKTLIQLIKSTTEEIMFDSAALANSFLDEPVDPSTIRSKGYLISTGIVWEACDRFNNLPKSNKQAVIIKWKEMLELLKDAILEIKNLLDQDDNKEDDGWDEIFGESINKTLSAREKEIVELSLKLFNLVKTLFNKILKRYLEPLDLSTYDENLSLKKINQTLDRYMDLGKLISDAADELGASLYSPQDPTTIESKVNYVSLHSQDLIKTILPIASQEDVNWFNTCDVQFIKILQSITEKNKK
ncbi:Grap2 and cyclin-D-interacting-domain-containing protein [Glomus cerebriforme]|uniref:Grap2 and cyclin-D-interacting-domain-containing protein n=1 Tax=Glomus cerebriforme TaxID=658196 RepID=A0A397SC64_9GLOM|nr:Grap2 and cyclin-D-interacting-domain-containing protein [Glomus cerebriforme]